MSRGVARCRDERDSVRDLTIAGYRTDVCISVVEPLSNCVGSATRHLELAFLNQDPSIRERRVVATVIKMKVRIHDDVHVSRGDAEFRKRLFEHRPDRLERAVDVFVAVSHTSVDENHIRTGKNEKCEDFNS